MDTSKIKRMIGQCESTDDLAAIIEAAQARISLVRNREKQQAEDSAWAAVKSAKEGYVLVFGKNVSESLYVSEGKAKTVIRRVEIRAGTAMVIVAVQPRAKRIWVKKENSVYGLTIQKLARCGAKVYRDELHAQVAMASGRI